MANSSAQSQQIFDTVQLLLEEMNEKMKYVPVQTGDSSGELVTNYVDQLKTYLVKRNYPAVKYTVNCIDPEPNEFFELSYYVCTVEMFNKVLCNSFPEKCLTSDLAVQVAAKRAFEIIKSSDFLSLSYFFTALLSS